MKHSTIFTGRSETTPQFTVMKGDRRLYNRNAIEKYRIGDAGPDRVRNEQWEWYDKCITRNRNTGKQLDKNGNTRGEGVSHVPC